MLLACLHDKNMAKQRKFADECGFTACLGARPLVCANLSADSLTEAWWSMLPLEDIGVEFLDVYEVDDDQYRMADAYTMNKLLVEAASRQGSIRVSTLKDAFDVDNPIDPVYLLLPGFKAKRTWHFDLRGLARGKVDTLATQCHLDDAQRQFLKDLDDELLELACGIDRDERATTRRTALRTNSEELHSYLIWSGVIPLIWATVTGRTCNSYLLSLCPYHFRRATGMRHYDELVDRKKEQLVLPASLEQTIHWTYVSVLNETARNLVAKVASETGVSRDDPCLCGSGKRLGDCCTRATMDEIALRWNDAPKRVREDASDVPTHA